MLKWIVGLPRMMWMAAKGTGRVSRREVEDWLSAALVPVEPERAFTRRLKARLVRYRGAGRPTIWAVVAGLGVATVVIVAGFGLALRLFLGLLGQLGLLERQPAGRPESQSTVA